MSHGNVGAKKRTRAPQPLHSRGGSSSHAHPQRHNPVAYREKLLEQIRTMPAHKGSLGLSAGWWCASPEIMNELLIFLAKKPTDSSTSMQVWAEFRDCVAYQFSVCRQCVINYHRAVAGMDTRTERSALQELTQWDVSRIIPSLARQRLRSSYSDDHSEKRARCKNAFLECLLSVRVCIFGGITDALGELFRKTTPVDSAEEMEQFLERCGSLPPGLLVLCFHQVTAVRSWAQRIYKQVVEEYEVDATAVKYVLRKALARVRASPTDASAKDNPVVSSKSVAWDGLGTILKFLDSPQIELFVDAFQRVSGRGQFLAAMTIGLESVDDRIVASAADSLVAVCKAVPLHALFVDEVVSPRGLLDAVILAYSDTTRTLSTKSKLLHLLNPILAGGRTSKASLSKLFQKGFGSIITWVLPQAVITNGAVSAVDFSTKGTDVSPEDQLLMRAGATLLRSYYLMEAPYVTFAKPQEVTVFLLYVLNRNGNTRWVRSLLRIMLLTDVFHAVRCLRNSENRKAIAHDFFLNQAHEESLGADERAVVQKIVDAERRDGSTFSYMHLLWKDLEVRCPAERIRLHSDEVSFFMDIHRIISMVHVDFSSDDTVGAEGDLSRTVQVGRSDLFNITEVHAELRDVCISFKTMQSTVHSRLSHALSSAEKQTWWVYLPFHATHLMNSQCKDVRNLGFKALMKSRGLENAFVHGGLSEIHLLLYDLKSDSAATSSLQKGCMSVMVTMLGFGSSLSLPTLSSFFLWLKRLWDCEFQCGLATEKTQWGLLPIFTFVQNWRAFEKRKTFPSYCGQIFHRLREMWNSVVSMCPTSEVDVQNFQDSYEITLTELCKELFDMFELQDIALRGSWVNTICTLAPFWRESQELREKAVLIIELQESSRKLYTCTQCSRIAESAQLHEVKIVLDRWSRPKDPMKETKITTFFSKGPRPKAEPPVVFVEKRQSSDKRGFSSKQDHSTIDIAGLGLRRNYERARPLAFAENRRIFTDNPSFKKGAPLRYSSRQTTRASFRNPHHSSHINELRRGLRTNRRDTVRKYSTTRRADGSKNDGGPTEMEKLVEAQKSKRAQESEKLKGNDSNSNKASSGLARIESDQVHQKNLCLTETKERNPAPSEVFVVEEETSPYALPSSKRMMAPRLYEQTFRSLLLNDPGEWESIPEMRHNMPGKFENVEAYVRAWQPIIVAEFAASVGAVMAAEQAHAEAEILATGEFKSCRAVFEVSEPIESVGYIQNISLRYLEENRSTGGKSLSGDRSFEYDSSRAQVLDIMLIDLAASRLDESNISSSQTVLGLVTKIHRQGQDFVLKLHVAFRQMDAAPGTGRRVRVSKLTGTSTLRRQLDAMWALPDAPDGLLWAILDPATGIGVNRDVCERLGSALGDSLSPYVSFVNGLLASKWLNESQAEAILDVVQACSPALPGPRSVCRKYGEIGKHGSLSLIQGPPGTGKTSTIVSLLSAMLFSDRDPQRWRPAKVQLEDGLLHTKVAPVRVLVCAPSNAAVDELMTRIMTEGLHTPGNGRASPRMLRIGGGTTIEEIRRFEIKNLVQYCSSGQKSSSSAKRLTQLLAEMAAINSSIATTDTKWRELRVSIDKAESGKDGYDHESRSNAELFCQLREQLTGLHQRKRKIGEELDSARLSRSADETKRRRESTAATCKLLNSTSVVFATLSSAGHETLRNLGVRFDVIIVDEAGQCGEPEVMIPITGGFVTKKPCSGPAHVILVGDPQQLPATVISTNKVVQKALSRSLFERINSSSPDAVHMLDVQYRMHPQISLFPSKQFYGGLLRDGSNVLSTDMHRSFHQDPHKRFGPLTFLDTSAADEKESKTSGGSVYNCYEARLIILAITTLVRAYGREAVSKNVVVLSPYRKQIYLLRQMIAENRDTRDCFIEVNTVDGIQGREKSIVFLSTVRSGHSGGIGFVNDERRMNVAITRAKHSLIIVGNCSALEAYSRLWRAQISHCRSQSLVVSIPKDPLQLFPESRRNAKVKPARFPEASKAPTVNFSSNLPECTDVVKKVQSIAKGIALRSAPVSRLVTSPEVNLLPEKAVSPGKKISLRNKPVDIKFQPRGTSLDCKPSLPGAPNQSKDKLPETHETLRLIRSSLHSDHRNSKLARIQDLSQDVCADSKRSAAQSSDCSRANPVAPRANCPVEKLTEEFDQERSPLEILPAKLALKPEIIVGLSEDQGLDECSPQVDASVRKPAPEALAHAKQPQLRRFTEKVGLTWNRREQRRNSRNVDPAVTETKTSLDSEPLPSSSESTHCNGRASPSYSIRELERVDRTRHKHQLSPDKAIDPVNSSRDNSSLHKLSRESIYKPNEARLNHNSPELRASVKRRESNREAKPSVTRGSRTGTSRDSVLNRVALPSDRLRRCKYRGSRQDGRDQVDRILTAGNNKAKRATPASQREDVKAKKKRRLDQATSREDRLKPPTYGPPTFSLVQAQQNLQNTKDMVRRARGL